MRLCVYGAGAVGGYLAVQLCQAGAHAVSVVARGAQREAIAAHGLTLWSGEQSVQARPHAVTDDVRTLAPQDLVFVTTKAPAQAAAADDIARLLGPAGCAVFVCNGIPWWWHHRGAAAPGQPLPLLDPHASLWNRVRPERVLGCVVYSANEVVRPGVVRHQANNRWLLGEPDGSASARLADVLLLLASAGLQAQASDDLRRDIWTKLLRNVALNPLCALTRLPVDALAQDAQLLALCHALVDEVAAVAGALGYDVSAGATAAKQASGLGGALDGRGSASIRPSMLQDVLQGRPTEVEAILGQVQRFAGERGVRSPTLDLLLPLVRALERGAASAVAPAA